MHEGHRQRLRDKYIAGGLDGFAPHEILELILFYSIPRSDTNPIAHTLIDKFGSLSNVFDADVKDLISTEGVGPQSAALIKLIPDLFRYYHKSKWEEQPVLANCESAGLYAADMLAESVVEAFYVLCLDSARKVISFVKITEGTSNDILISRRLVLEAAVRNRAEGVIIVHNHPTGRLYPSESDRELTYTLAKAFDAINITLLDHLIVGGSGGYFSFIENGLLK